MFLEKVDLEKLFIPKSVVDLELFLEKIKEVIRQIFPSQKREYGLVELKHLLNDEHGRAVHQRLVTPFKILQKVVCFQRNAECIEQLALHLGLILFAQNEPEVAQSLNV